MLLHITDSYKIDKNWRRSRRFLYLIGWWLNPYRNHNKLTVHTHVLSHRIIIILIGLKMVEDISKIWKLRILTIKKMKRKQNRNDKKIIFLDSFFKITFSPPWIRFVLHLQNKPDSLFLKELFKVQIDGFQASILFG